MALPLRNPPTNPWDLSLPPKSQGVAPPMSNPNMPYEYQPSGMYDLQNMANTNWEFDENGNPVPATGPTPNTKDKFGKSEEIIKELKSVIPRMLKGNVSGKLAEALKDLNLNSGDTGSIGTSPTATSMQGGDVGGPNLGVGGMEGDLMAAGGPSPGMNEPIFSPPPKPMPKAPAMAPPPAMAKEAPPAMPAPEPPPAAEPTLPPPSSPESRSPQNLAERLKIKMAEMGYGGELGPGPAFLDLRPLGAMVDTFTGSNIEKSLTPPETYKEAMARRDAMKGRLLNHLAQEDKIKAEILKAMAKGGGNDLDIKLKEARLRQTVLNSETFKNLKSYNGILQTLNDFENVFNKKGVQFFGSDSAELGTLYQEFIMKWKNDFAKLGALTGSDLQSMKQYLTDPTDLSSIMRLASRGGEAGVKAQLNKIRQSLTQAYMRERPDLDTLAEGAMGLVDTSIKNLDRGFQNVKESASTKRRRRIEELNKKEAEILKNYKAGGEE